MSIALPAVSGMITRIGCRVGQVCAWAGKGAAISKAVRPVTTDSAKDNRMLKNDRVFTSYLPT